MKKNQKGFSLIELLIVVAIILIIAAIAIPNLLRSKMAANESSAVGSLRTLNTACITYNSTYQQGYPAALANLGPCGAAGCVPTPATADLVDNVLAAAGAAPGKSGYLFLYASANANTTYTINANPVTVGTTGQRYFYTDQTAVIRFNAAGAASAASQPIQ